MKKALPEKMFAEAEQSRLTMLRAWVLDQGVTEIEKVPNRGHSLTIDSGWREVAERALAFVKRFV